MGSEEDEEVLLKDSQLHLYLSQLENNKCDDICEDIPKHENSMHYSDIEEMKTDSISDNKISQQVKSLIEILLNSGMMLEEDAHLLYLYQLKFQVYNDNITLKTALSVASLILTGLGTIYFEYGPISANIGCGAVTIYFIKNYLLQWYLSRSINKLCTNLNLAYRTLKKRINFVHRLIKHLTTKQIHRARMCSTEINDYHWAQNQLSLISFQLVSSLLETTIFSKKSIISLLEKIKISENNEQSIAHMTDNQLGLDKFKKIKGDAKFDMSTIEVIRHLNILMQSEFLRLIGFSLCKCTNFGQLMILANIVQSYSEYIANHTSDNIGPLLPKEYKNKQKNNKINLIEDVQNVRLHLYSIVVELADIEDRLDNKNLSEEEAIETINLVAKNVKRETEDCNLFIQKIEKRLTRRECTNSSEQIKTDTKLPASDAVKTGIEVGKSDFSINSPDEVFVAVSTQVDEEVGDNEFDIETSLDKNMYSTYDNVLSEMKDILYQKREECMKRESVALKQNPNYESYLNFQDDSDNEIDTTSKTIRKRGRLKYDEPEKQFPIFNPNVCKEIAQKAVTKSLNWNHSMIEETSFEG